MLCGHNHYILGDIQTKDCYNSWIEELNAHVKNINKTIYLPLRLYDHGGLRMDIGVSGGWDFGQVGWIYAEYDKIKEWFNLKKNEHLPLNKVEEILRTEVDEYDKYLSGDIYSFTLYEKTCCKECGHIEEKLIDSCGGFYGTNFKGNGLIDHLPLEIYNLINHLKFVG